MSALARWSMAPTSYSEARDFALAISKSALAPKDYMGKPENALIAMAMGADVGLSPMQAIQNISVINGRPSLWGDAMLAVVQGSPDFEDCIETFEGETATCTLKLRGRAPVVRTFSYADAKKAGLWGKQGPWQQYPQRMAQMRARGFCLRDGAAYILKGLQSAEEASDYTDAPRPAEVRATASIVVEQPKVEAKQLEPDYRSNEAEAGKAHREREAAKAAAVPCFSPKWQPGEWGAQPLSSAPLSVLELYAADLQDTDVSEASEASKAKMVKLIADAMNAVAVARGKAAMQATLDKARRDVAQNPKAAAAIYGDAETSEDDEVDPETGELVNQSPGWGMEPAGGVFEEQS